MGKIMFFNTSDNIQKVVAEFIETLKDQSGVKAIRADLDNAVHIARGLNTREVDAIVARGNTALALSNARLPFPVIPILVGTEEIADAFHDALELTGKSKPLIGVSGFEQSISNIKALLSLSGIEIRFYPIECSEDIRTCALNAMRDKVDVMISGTLCTCACQAQGVPAVEMKTSMDSIRLAYNQALEFQKSSMRQRALSEQESMLSRYTPEILIAINGEGHIISGNEQAGLFLNIPPATMKGVSLISRYTFESLGMDGIIRLALDGSIAIINHNRKDYALSVTSAPLQNGKESYVLRIQSVASIQRSERAVRRALAGQSSISVYSPKELELHGLFTRETMERIRPYFPLSSPLLLSAEPGCGAEIMARSIHAAVARHGMPFVSCDCEEFASDGEPARLEARMHELFKSAHNGTLFMDGIDLLPKRAQLVVLSIAQHNQIPGHAGSAPLPVNVRLITSCKPTIYSHALSGEFKAELFYLLAQNSVPLPPIREHAEDISKIFSFFISQSSGENGAALSISLKAEDELKSYPWYGNLHQLQAFCRNTAELGFPTQLSEAFLRRRLRQWHYFEESNCQSTRLEVPSTSEDSQYVIVKNTIVSREKLLSILSKNKGSKSKAAEELGISRTSLWKCLKELEIQ